MRRRDMVFGFGCGMDLFYALTDDGIFLFCFALLCKYCRKKYINIAKSLEILSVLYYHIT